MAESTERQGLRAVHDQPLLLTLAVTAALFNLFDAILLASVAEVAIAFVRGTPAWAVAQVAGAEAALEAGVVLYAINSTSLRQAVVPDRLQGRVTATLGLISGGVTPVGALLGGLLAERYGLRPTVLVAGAGTLLAFLWIMRSPIRRLHSTPLTPDP